MTDCIREQIIAAFAAQLAAVTGVSVERNRDAPTNALPALIILDGDMESEDSESYMAKYRMQVTVEGWVISTTANVGKDVNNLYARALQKALEDRTLGNLALDISELNSDFDIDRSDGKKPVGFFSTTYLIEFFTKQGDPFSLAP